MRLSGTPRFTINFPRVTQLPRLPCRLFAIGVAAAVLPAPRVADAQSVMTVRESEFRSRWQNYQVDLPRDTPPSAEGEAAAQRPKQSVRSFFQNGPVVLRASLGLGWESSNEQRYTATTNSAESSLFAAPSIALIYDREIGPWDVSVRYSGGYVYFFTPDYLGGGKNGIQSQTAGADFQYRGTRLDVRSNTAASYGSGYDIQRADQSDRLIFSQLLAADYQVGEFIRAGANAGFGYAFYPSDADGTEDSQIRFSSALYADYFWTGRTRLRLEAGAGNETQTTGGSTFDRTYSQALFKVNYRASEKLTAELGLGVGVVEDSNALDTGNNGFRTIYTLALDYAPTEKTSVRLYFGLDGTNIRPEFSLAVNWHPRENTYATLSVYQRANLSTVVLAQDQLTRGVLGSVRQRLFGRVDLAVGGGYEVETALDSGDSNSSSSDPDAYFFVGGSLSWQMNSWASWQLDSRVASRRYQTSSQDQNLQTRTSISLRLTF